MSWYFLYMLLFIIGFSEAFSQLNVSMSASCKAFLSPGAVVQINGNLTLANSSTFTQSGAGNIYITGDWTNNGGTFTPGSGTVTFMGTSNKSIAGTGQTTFNYLDIYKTGTVGNDILTLNHTATANSDVLIRDGIFRYDNTAVRTLTVNGSILINSGNTFDVSATGSRTHNLSVSGDITNNGTLDFNTSATCKVNTTFTGSANSLVSGSGGTTDFNEIITNKTSQANEIQVSPTNFTTIASFLTLNGGTFHVMGSYTLNQAFFKTYPTTIGATSGLWIDNTNCTVSGQSGDLTLAGLLRLSKGSITIGSGNTQNLLYSSGSTITIEGGTLNISTRLSRDVSNGSTVNYTQTGGLLNISTRNSNNSATRASFDIGGTNSSFTWSGGIIEHQNRNTDSTVGDYYNIASTSTVTGGLLRINLLTTSTFYINSLPAIGSLFMHDTTTAHPTVKIKYASNPLISIDSIRFDGSGQFDCNYNDISLGGNWLNNSTNATPYVRRNKKVTFNGSTNQTIGGGYSTSFNVLALDKTGGNVILDKNTTVYGHIRLLQNGLIELKTFDLTLQPNSNVYSNNGTGQSFNDNKFITNTLDLTGGRVIKLFSTGTPATDTPFLFPVGTSTSYTPASFMFLSGSSTFSTNAQISVRPIAQEHPNVEKFNVSLKKYWQITSSNISYRTQGVNLRFDYKQGEVMGSEGNYIALQFVSPTWYPEPGYDCSVNSTSNIIYSDYTPRGTPPPAIDGDWTAGEPEVARAVYYSLGGNYNVPASWSKNSYGGTASTSAPSKATDKIFIGDGKTITLTANTPNAATVVVEETSGGRGRLDMGTFTVNGDTCRIMSGGILGIGEANGITNTGATGNVRSTNRYFSTAATYIFNSKTQSQVTGSGLPSTVKALYCDKATGFTLTLTNSVLISDTLGIYDGTLDDNDKSIDGETSGRTLFMTGGIFKLRDLFPINYTPPTFTAGQINFEGTSVLTVPSSTSSPAINQYNDLRIAGARGYSDVTFEPSGEVKIQGSFTLPVSFTVFNMGSTRMKTSGSTIVFNGTNQNIPRNTATSASGDDYRLLYYNLKIQGTGTKTLIDGDHRIYNDITLSSSTLSVAALNLEVRGNWNNIGGDFNSGTQTVTFNNTEALDTNTIVSKAIPFYNVTIQGNGALKHNDQATDYLKIKGNWTNTGTFEPGTGTIEFTGNVATQTLTNTNTEKFYNLSVNKSAGIVQLAANTNINIANNLSFIQGVIDARTNGRYVQVASNATRTGTGHVDGNLRINIPVGAGAVLYPIGAGINYRPATLTFSGTDGTAGYLNIIDNARTADAPNFTEIGRQWDVSIPTGGSFTLGNRTYNTVFTFVAGDVIGNALYYETRRQISASWATPTTGTRTSLSTESLNNNQLAAVGATANFVIGTPSVLSYYSIADGNWTSAASWSTAGYGGGAAPAAPAAGAKVYIGDGKTITLNSSYPTGAGDSVIVETGGASPIGGKLICGSNLITGPGSFALRTGGALSMGNASGITTAGATGNIQTTNRNYNEGNHNNGHFIYTTAAAQFTGNGLPSTVKTLTINNSGNTVTLTAAVTVSDSLHIQAGTLDVSASNYGLSVQGNWRNAGTFTYGTGTVTFSGTNEQKLYNSSGETFYNLTLSKASSSVTLIDNNITINNTLTFTSGLIDARTNSRAVIIGNSGTVNRTSGHVYGELRKYMGTGDLAALTYEVGDSTYSGYTPAVIDVNGTGGTAGRVGVGSYGHDHPLISSSALNTNKNVQRYWEILNNYGFDLGATRTVNVTVTYLNPNDIRGGANTNNFIINIYNAGWSEPSTTYTRTTTTTQVNGLTSMSGEFVVGEIAAGRVFYSRNGGGDWDNDNTWSNTGYNGPPSTNYPSNSGILTDIVYIGNGDIVNLNTSCTISSVTVEEVSGNGGRLNLNTNILYGDQFSLKNGGILDIGSEYGITSSTTGATGGNVQTTIRDYNNNNHNNGKFIYSGSASSTGDGLPSNIATLTINSSTVTLLTNDVTTSSTITISSGTFSANSNKNITVGGNWINNSSFISGSSATVTFNGNIDQEIKGSSSTTFNNLNINKTAGDLLLGQNTSVDGILNIASNSLLKLNSYDLTIGLNGYFAGGTFGSTKMVQSDGSSTAGKIIKLYNTGTNTQNFTFPVGVGSNYNQAVVNLTATFGAGSQLSLRLRSGLHPNRVAGAGNMLAKYWSIDTTGISAITASSLQFTYSASDINGTIGYYIPGLFASSGWDVNLGTSRTVTGTLMTVTNHTALKGDWTAGEPGTLKSGQVYYSLATGNWNATASWTHSPTYAGNQVIYIPGTFPNDTIFIANNRTIYYNSFGSNAISISSCTIGSFGATTGDLSFTNGSNKSLTIQNSMFIDANGAINENGAGNRYDTLFIQGNIENRANGTGTRIANFRTSATANTYTYLTFSGNSDSQILGTGSWDLWDVKINKPDGREDTVKNQSTSFSTALTANNSSFILTSGVYKHDNTGTAILSRTAAYQMGIHSGLYVHDGTVNFLNTLTTNSDNLVKIDGGVLNIGDAGGEHFKYNSGTDFIMAGGRMVCASSFSRNLAESTVGFTMSSGTLTVVTISNPAGSIGFEVANESSTFTQSGGIIIIRNISSSGDYQVNAGTVNVTGGTLQIGEIGTYFASTSGDIAVGNSVPTIYNLDVKYTMANATTLRAMVVNSNPLYVINDVTIGTNACLDLNTNSLSIGGDFINNGTFDTDGPSWQSGSGVKTVTFCGDTSRSYGKADQKISIAKPLVAPQDHRSTYLNEAFFNITIDKATKGRVILGDTTNSNLIIRNILRFELNNNGIIDARTNSKYVWMDKQDNLSNTPPTDLGRIDRAGLGHVNGRLIRDVDQDASILNYYVGTDTAYTPAILELVGTGGSRSPLDIITWAGDPGNIGGAGMDVDNSVYRWWRIGESYSSFALSGRTYKFTTIFLKIDDTRNGATWSNRKHFRTASDPDLISTSGAITDSSVQSINNTAINEYYVVGELIATKFYTRGNGNWTDANNWSLVGYGDPAPAPFPPNAVTHEAYIGNSNTITLDANVNIRSCLVENAGAGPGVLHTGLYTITGETFTLADDCTFSTKHREGVRALPSTSGVIKTTVLRLLGVSNYIYNGELEDQRCGDALAGTIKSLYIDNHSYTTTLNNPITINKDLTIDTSTFDAGGKTINLYGNFIMTDSTYFGSGSGIFEFDGNNQQNIQLGDPDGISFYQTIISKPSGTITVTGSQSSANVTVQNRLTFSGTNQSYIDVRTNDRKVIMGDGSTIVRNGVTPYGHIDGILERPVGAAAQSVDFPIGYTSTYAPVTITLDNTLGNGTAGSIDAINIAPIPNGYSNGAFYGNRMDQNACVPRYWKLDSLAGFTMGLRKANLTFSFPIAEYGLIDINKAVMRRKSAIPTETPQWSERKYSTELNWSTNPTMATVNVKVPPSTLWPSVCGEYYIGHKSPRTFYSIASGNWNSSGVWSFDSHSGIVIPAGEYPNPDADNKDDNIEIGLSHVITLNSTQPDIDTIRIINDAELDMQANKLNCFECDTKNKGQFRLYDNAMLSLSGTNNPDNNTLINFTSKEYSLANSSNTTIRFWGTQTLTPSPFGYSEYFGNVHIDQVGTKNVVTPILIHGNLLISNNAGLNVNNINSLWVYKNIINSALLQNYGVIEIGQ